MEKLYDKNIKHKPGLFFDLENYRFGKLLVVKYSHNKNYYHYWECKCDCGNIKIIDGNNLRKGVTKSCGCLHKQIIGEKSYKNGYAKNYYKFYQVYKGMIDRCYKINHKAYKDYGARGIKICDEWLNDMGKFINFCKDNYKENTQIDRIDNNLGYYPENCRFVTSKENCNNRRNTIKVTINNKTKSLKEWTELLGINYNSILSKRRKGIDINAEIKQKAKELYGIEL